MALGGGAWAVALCRLQRGFYGVFEDSPRGSLDSDGCEAEWLRYETLLKLCPDREREECGCCAHCELGKVCKELRQCSGEAL